MDNATVFGQGCDARIAGEPMSACPYSPPLARFWHAGWRHANRFWSVDVKRWPAQRLPTVREQEGNP